MINDFVNVVVDVNVNSNVYVNIDIIVVKVIVDDFALLSYFACIVWRAQCQRTMVRNLNSKLQNADKKVIR